MSIVFYLAESHQINLEISVTTFTSMKSSKAFVISLQLLILIIQLATSKEKSGKPSSCDKSRQILSENHGYIENAAASNINYTQNTHCEWLIDGNSSYISLTFHHMDTECGYDYVFIYDGSSLQGTYALKFIQHGYNS